MKFTNYVSIMAACSMMSFAHADSVSDSQRAGMNYDWMNKVVNQTPPSKKSSCPTLDVDRYNSGFSVALQRNFGWNLSKSISKWFPKDQLWASVGVGPVKNSFGIFFSNVNKISEVEAEQEKHLPVTQGELVTWRVSDSAYWESQGGVAFYIGAGISPISVGTLAVATGGWANYLQKTGPNKVYVERSRKKIRSISLGVGVILPSAEIGRVSEHAKGFAYEFDLDNKDSVEAFERFMAGDTTKAFDLSKNSLSGVVKVADNSEDRIGLSRGWSMAVPFIPVAKISSGVETAYDHSEESTMWDEEFSKDTGIYIKSRSTRLLDKHVKVARSFAGGIKSKKIGDISEQKLFGNFKYSYQSDWGQEDRLRRYIENVQSLTGIASETCVQVPEVSDSLNYNQITLEMNLSDEYMRELIGKGQSQNFLGKLRKSALRYQLAGMDTCQNFSNEDKSELLDNSCATTTEEQVFDSFANLKEYAQKMNATYGKDGKQFSRYMAKFGQEVWKNPFVFKAFFEKGKQCGQEFKYEVSGRRISRHAVGQTWKFNSACLN